MFAPHEFDDDDFDAVLALCESAHRAMVELIQLLRQQNRELTGLLRGQVARSPRAECPTDPKVN